MGLSKLRILIHQSAESKVTQFNVILGVYEDICWLDVSMEYFSAFMVMTVDQGRHNLSKYFPNDVLSYVLFALFTLFEEGAYIASRTILHDDVDCRLLPIDNSVVVSHYIWVV